MPIRRSPTADPQAPPQPGRDHPEWVVAINRNARSQSIGIGGRNQPVRASGAEDGAWAVFYWFTLLRIARSFMLLLVLRSSRTRREET